MSIMNVADFIVFSRGLDHPECVSWGPDGHLYAGGEAGQIYRTTLDGQHLTELGSTRGSVLGICLDADANVYACDPGNAAVMRVRGSGQVMPYSKGLPERGFVTPNSVVFDRGGNLYVSDSGSWRKDDGSLWVVRPGGRTELIDDSLLRAFPNGIALNAAADHLYVVLSTLPGVARVPVDDGHVVGPYQLVASLPRCVPDGLAFDVEGNLYITCYTPDVIYRLDPSGTLEILVEDWEGSTLARPTNLTFAGPDRKTLVAANRCRWHLAKAAMPVAGQSYHYPRLPLESA